MVSTDRKVFDEGSAVRIRMVEYARLYKSLLIVVFSTERHDPVEIAPNATLYSTNSLSRLRYVPDARRIGKKLIRKIEKETPIVLICQDPFETGLVGKALSALRKNIELVVQIHTDIFSPYFFKHSFLNKVRIGISKGVLPHADRVQVVSRRIADSLGARGVASESIVLKPVVVDVDRFASTPPSFDLHERFPHFKKIVMMASRLEPEKNIEAAISAWEKVHTEFPDAGLIIIGSGSLSKSLAHTAKKLGLEKSIVFLDWQADLVPYYKGSDLFLLTSFFEGYGMTLKEAEACGTKILSTDVGIAREVGATSIPGFESNDIAQALIYQLK